MPTTRSASSAKKPSSSAKIDASLGEPGEGSGSRFSDVGELNDDLEVCLLYSVTVHLVGLSGKNSEPSFRTATWVSESQEDSGRLAS